MSICKKWSPFVKCEVQAVKSEVNFLLTVTLQTIQEPASFSPCSRSRGQCTNMKSISNWTWTSPTVVQSWLEGRTSTQYTSAKPRCNQSNRSNRTSFDLSPSRWCPCLVTDVLHKKYKNTKIQIKYISNTNTQRFRFTFFSFYSVSQTQITLALCWWPSIGMHWIFQLEALSHSLNWYLCPL